MIEPLVEPIEEINLTELEHKIVQLNKRGKTYNQILNFIWDGWQYGKLKIEGLKSPSHLREIINNNYKEQLRLF